MDATDAKDRIVVNTREAPATESTRYLGETAFGTVEKVCAVCMVVNDKVADPKMAEKIYNYIQDMFGPEALDYENAYTPMPSDAKKLGKGSVSTPIVKGDSDPLW